MAILPAAPGAGAVVPHFATDDPWQMSFGERTGLVGIVDTIRPKLAIEIGTAEGGSLRRIAAASDEVHSFDLVTPQPHVVEGLDNVTVHTGDSRLLVPELLATIAAESRNVDFALVDGDHSSEGIAIDMRNLLDSPAVGRTVIIMHDSMNEWVRAGLESVAWDAHSKVVHVDLDWIPGHWYRDTFESELWGGLALVVVDADHPRAHGVSASVLPYQSSHEVAVSAREAEARIAALQTDLDRARAAIAALQASPSWQLTAPLRAIKRVVRRST